MVVPVSVVPLEVRTDQLTTFEGPLHWSRPWTFTPSKETSTEMPEVGSASLWMSCSADSNWKANFDWGSSKLVTAARHGRRVRQRVDSSDAGNHLGVLDAGLGDTGSAPLARVEIVGLAGRANPLRVLRV